MKRTFKVKDSFLDDHQPCVTFMYRQKTFTMRWTSGSFEDHLEAYDESESLQKKYRKLAKRLDALIDDPTLSNVEKVAGKNWDVEEQNENGQVTNIFTSIGMLERNS